MSSEDTKEIIDRNGNVSVRRTDGKFAKGHSANPHGRPKGSRNKSSLLKAQLEVDNASEAAAKMFTAIMTGNEEDLAEFGLKPSDVNAKLKMDAAKQVMAMAKDEMKALKAENEESQKEKDKKEDTGPIFSSVARINRK